MSILIKLSKRSTLFKKERQSQARYNIAVLGKTGVGKSTLINYLLGIPVAKTGVGKPVTVSIFDHYDFRLNDLPVRIFDSKGLESGKSEEWIENLQYELDVHNTDNSPSKWFHTVIYCISAGGARIEDFEISVIKEFAEAKYKVIAVLTKADQATEKEQTELSKLLNSIELDIQVIPVCSEEKELLGGNIVKPFGRDELKKEIYDNFWDSISLRLPERCMKVMMDIIDNWESKQRSYVRDHINNANGKEIQETLHHRSIDFLEELRTTDLLLSRIKEEFKSVMELYEKFNAELGYLPDREVFNTLNAELTINNNLEGLTDYLQHLPAVVILVPFKYGMAAVSQIADISINWIRGEVFMAQDHFMDLSLDNIINNAKNDNKNRLFNNLDIFTTQIKEGIKALKSEIETAIKETIKHLKS